MTHTDAEKEVLNWLSNQRDEGRGRISWESFTSKVEEVTGKPYEQLTDDEFGFNLIGVTVSLDDGKEMYPIRDLEQGITRGYSTD